MILSDIASVPLLGVLDLARDTVVHCRAHVHRLLLVVVSIAVVILCVAVVFATLAGVPFRELWHTFLLSRLHPHLSESTNISGLRQE